MVYAYEIIPPEAPPPLPKGVVGPAPMSPGGDLGSGDSDADGRMDYDVSASGKVLFFQYWRQPY